MSSEVTMFTGQWVDMPCKELFAEAAKWNHDGLEPATWGDHTGVIPAMERECNTVEACSFVREVDFVPSTIQFDAAFARRGRS